ncbi:helix-turn-helix domain-containing protein [Streptomyces albus]
MGRPSSALARSNPTKTLAQWLESLRQRSGLSWSQVAQAAAETDLVVSRSTLFRSVQGETVPKWKTVQVFARVCGGDEREAKRLWYGAACRAVTRTGVVRRTAVLSPQFITEPWQLIHAMNRMRRENGEPTLRELEEKATVRGVSFLPRSTVSAVLRGRMPAKPLLRHFVRCCGNVPEHRLKDWEDAWDRADAHRRGGVPVAAGEAQDALARAEEELRRIRARLDEARGQLGEATAALRRVTRAARAPAPCAGPAVPVPSAGEPAGAQPRSVSAASTAGDGAGLPPQGRTRRDRRRSPCTTVRPG